MTHPHALAKLARLMSPEPADILHPNRLIKSQAVLEGELPIKTMERLKNILVHDEDSVAYRLEFGADEMGRKIILENISATISLSCQRCLGEVRVDINSENRLAIVANNEAAQELPTEYEPLVITEDELSLRALIEDELLLALPISPTHAVDECPVKLEPPMKTEKQNPFAVIKQLQKTK